MREILFRGKRKINNEWIYGDYFRSKIFNTELGLRVAHSITYYHNDIEHSHIVDPSTIGQYTGLTDKNGKKIFEGDIVSGFFNHEKIVGYIFYGSDASFFIQRDGLFGIGLNNASDWLEVIGNIHDNPELLEDEP